MDKMNNAGKWLVVGIVVVMVIIVAVVYGPGQSQSPAPQTVSPSPSPSGTPAATEPTATPSPASAGTGSTGGAITPAHPPAIVINLITPVKNDLWMINKPNPIVWDREAGVTGEIDLLDATTKNLVGVILSETGAHQTSYSWDTRQIYLLRYSPLKKDITAGNYVLRLKFDGNNLPSLTSYPFTITQ